MNTPMTEASKKHYVYKRDKARHHQLMARESDPYRGQSTTTVDEDEVKPVSRPKFNPDRSGLGKMGGATTRRAGDHYAGLKLQQAALRRERLMPTDQAVTDADRDEVNEWLKANNMSHRI